MKYNSPDWVMRNKRGSLDAYSKEKAISWHSAGGVVGLTQRSWSVTMKTSITPAAVMVLGWTMNSGCVKVGGLLTKTNNDRATTKL